MSGPILRYDVTTRDWVLYSSARGRRPTNHSPSPSANDDPRACPFCPGNESLSPEEVLRFDDGKGGWLVRVVPNKFPALVPRASGAPKEEDPMFREEGGYGVHEVLIESPDHRRPLNRQPLEQTVRVLDVLHERYLSLMRDRRLRAIIAFKNHGERAGTSLSHPHMQLIATPVVPRLLRLKHQIAMEYYDRNSTCLYRDLLQRELEAGRRVLARNERFAAVLPFASHVAYQVRILPLELQSSFAEATSGQLRLLADLLREVLTRIENALDAPDYNLTLNTAPLDDGKVRYFLWHIDVLPRLSTPAGFELGSGMSINTVLPEDAAAVLRAASAEYLLSS